MPSIILDDADRLRQRWSELVTDVTPSHLPTGLFSKRQTKTPVGKIDVDLNVSLMQACSQEHDVSPLDLVQAAWAAMLRSYSGSEDITYGGIGLQPSNSKQQVTDAALCRIRLESDISILSIPQQTLKEGLHSADLLLSFPETLQVLASLDPKPCNTAIWLRDSTSKAEISENEIVGGRTFDYVLRIDPSLSTLDLIYHKPTVSQAQAEYIANTFADILHNVCTDPFKPVSTLCHPSELDTLQIGAWNRILPKESAVCVDRLIEEAAQRNPNSPAIFSWDGQMTYAQFNQTACRVASYLESVGVRRGQLVPVCFEKSRWTIITMIALWKVGAAWVPLDPRHPRQRIETIVESVKATTVMTSEANQALLAGIAPQVITVDAALIESIKTSSDVEFESRSRPHDISFVMFTSGSTGKPKGVVHEHASVASSALHHGPAMNINEDTRALQFGAYTFIISTFEIFTTLIFGGCLCIPSDHDRHTDIRPALRSMDANWAIFTPSFARSLKTEDAPTLKTLILAGEAVAQDIIDRWAAVARLINIYGASECSVCMIGPMVTDTPRSCIGRAVGALSWIVDANDHDRLVPIGAAGELIMEGPTLARGYLADPERTQAVYIKDPKWAQQPGITRQFYKTGDLARYGDDGRIHLIGRKDLQVKIRGQRVELTEIEAHMRAINNQVKTAVSMVQPQGKAMLVAFISSQSGFGPEFQHPFHATPTDHADISGIASQMNTELVQRLPPYMIPSAFIPLAYMPLTASGKTDRRMITTFGTGLSLSELAALAGGPAKSTRTMPSTADEKQLQQLWSEILHCSPEEIGVEDNFFHLGGDSIEAMNLVRRCRAEGYQLQVSDIMDNLVLRDMAKVMVPGRPSTELPPARPFELLGDDEESIRSEIQVASGFKDAELIQDAYPCTPLQTGLMALSAKISGSYIARHTLELPANLSVDRFKELWEIVVANNDVLRTRMVETDRYGTVQMVCRDRIQWGHGSDLEEYLQADEAIPMHMGDALTRHAIVESATDKTSFVLTIHHAIYDGLSLEMLFNDLLDALQGSVPPARPQFRDFVQHVVEKNKDEATETYWRNDLAEGDLIAFPTLPSATYQPLANESLIHNLKVHRNGPSDFTTATLIRAAWTLLQARYCDSPDTVFGCTVSGRNASVRGVEDVVGPVIATVPIKAHLEPQQSVNDYLKAVHAHSVEMTPYQNYGLQNIARVCDNAPSACSFQTLLVIQPASSVPEASLIQPFSAPRASFSTVALTLECSLSADGGVLVHVHFDNAVLPRGQVERIVQQLEHVLQQLAQEPAGRTLADLELISPRDMSDLLQWNRTIPEATEDCVHNLIAKNTMVNPTAPAVCAWDGNLTYAELDNISSKLAAHLMNAGVGPEVFVPLCFEKSMWTIVAMLATMKAGGAFVPMDASQPSSRMQLVVQEVNAHVMLCSEEQLGRCPGLVEKAIAVGPGMAQASMPQMSQTPVAPSNAAYVIFTSGSTGTPKGSVVEHRAFCTGALAHKEGLQMGRRVLQFASYTFDASVLEILSTLVQGGCVCVPSEAERRGNIAEAMTRMNVDWAVLTPSFVSTIDPATVPTLETLCLAGEAMTATHVATWTPYVRLVNGYGPSECCVCSSSNRRVVPGTAPNDIGTAVGGACWVTDRDDHNKLAPVGCIGELLVEGHTLARHYLKNAEKTAAAFIPRPAWLPWSRCDRLYKTGDLVKHSADGSLQFIGRKDTQVKIRGQRVELGEIEYHLCLPAAVSQAIVSYPKKGIYANKLIATLELTATSGDKLAPVAPVTLQETGFDLPALSQSMSETLPAHMVPVIWIVVEKIPSSSSTKIDRKAVDTWLAQLPADFAPTMGLKRNEPTVSTLRPDEGKALAISNKIASLVSRDDSSSIPLQGHDFNIASMGIDSVQVISLASFIKQTYGVKVDVSRILDGQMTVRSLAALLDAELTGTAPATVSPASTFDAMKEATALMKSIITRSPVKKTVFVTGVTGFLGTQILRQLCDRPDVGRVIAHVRAATPSEAFIRVKDAAVRAQWWSDYYLTKLDVWAGNLAQPRLGLKAKQWASLTGESPNEGGLVHAIIHAGAAVNWNAGTEVLRAANVDSTAELIKAAVSSPARPRLVYVSGGHRWHPDEDDREIAAEVAHANGYAQTKYLSELLVKQFAARYAGQFAIVKPGLILGTPEEGVANTDDFVWRLASAVVDARCYSRDVGESSWMFVTSSTRVAEETIHQAFCPADAMRTVTFMTDGITEREFWDIFHHELQYPLRAVDHATYLDTLQQAIQRDATGHPLWPVMQVFEAIDGRLSGGDVLPDASVVTPSQRQHVKATVRRNVQFLVDAGFIASPTGKKMRYMAEKVFQRSGNVWENVKGMVNGLA
ncbi:amino acid adenylation [Aspergillus aculeatinus CBS 121060]|uniref:Amino acid adenylation n=1 Tax=Aspergillus aculeatinus CBS 121060 TaxID=1448322 RepID=A0ACD1HBV9_9EURO|nr:amino acid adenylation [Aspergillus aculeatinus CBS 121060]RAH71302.1 amino acid adenylation [Aspergillus aculeatinus CBS 121060]